jgi:hypothetical protein
MQPRRAGTPASVTDAIRFILFLDPSDHFVYQSGSGLSSMVRHFEKTLIDRRRLSVSQYTFGKSSICSASDISPPFSRPIIDRKSDFLL